jgi:hypothetical protein
MRSVLRLLLSPVTISVIGVLIFLPLVLATYDVGHELWTAHDSHEAMDIVEGMGVILIGWGVALEERGSLREIFALGTKDEAWQASVDHICHASGIGLLVFGLFAEMCIELIRLPHRITHTHSVTDIFVGASALFLALSVIVLFRHIVAMVGVTIHGRKG